MPLSKVVGSEPPPAEAALNGPRNYNSVTCSLPVTYNPRVSLYPSPHTAIDQTKPNTKNVQVSPSNWTSKYLGA